MGLRTAHEMKMERDRYKLAELNRLGLSGYWVNRRHYGRFKGLGDL